jgi:hypothetical protein
MVKAAKAEPWTYFFVRLLFRVRHNDLLVFHLGPHDF